MCELRPVVSDNTGLWVIYGLRVVDDPEYRYIGCTRIGAKARLAQHRYDAKAKRVKSRHVLSWIKANLDSVVIDVLELCPDGDMDYLFEAEEYWISQIRSFGHRLTNLSDGGPSGSFGARWKLRDDQVRKGPLHPMYGKTVSADHIEKLASARRGTKMSPESRAKMSVSRSGENHWAYGGGKFSDEHRRKISETNKGPSSLSTHVRWHTNKGISKPETCKHCKEGTE